MTVSNYSNSTEAFKSGLNLTLQPIEVFIMNGIQQRFSSVFECFTFFVSSSDESGAINKVFGGNKDVPGNVKYPYTVLKLGSLDINAETAPAHPKTMLRNQVINIRTGQAGDESMQTRAFAMHVLPVTFQVNFKFVTNDARSGISFAKMLMIHSIKGGSLDFNVVYGHAVFSVKFRAVTSVAVPEGQSVSGAAGSSDEHIYTGTLNVDGFVSSPTLTERQVVNTLKVDFLMSQDGGIDPSLGWTGDELNANDYDVANSEEYQDALQNYLKTGDSDIGKAEPLFSFIGKTHNSTKPANQSRNNTR